MGVIVGGAVSMTIGSAGDGLEKFAAGTALLEAKRIAMLCGPSASAGVVRLYVVAPLTSCTLESATPSTESVTYAPAGAAPVNVGVLSLVRLSLEEMPLSDELVRSGWAGVNALKTASSALNRPAPETESYP